MKEDKEIWIAEHAHPTLRTIVTGNGSVPEEAVANLWLVINNKS